jgi:hypothetical protein
VARGDNSNDEAQAEVFVQDPNVVTPVQLAKELNIRPQVIFGWIRNGSLPSHKCVCGHNYLMRDEVRTFLAEREAKRQEREAKIAAELAVSKETEAVAQAS